MRYVHAAITIAVALLLSSVVFGQGFSITNYQFVGEQPITVTKSQITYRADLVNSGGPFGTVTANVITLNPSSVRTIPGQDVLNFSPVPANSQVTSKNTFTVVVDKSVPFDFSSLQWSFQTTPAGPIANAGPNQTVKVGSTVTLDGSRSSNPSGAGTLSYLWTFVSKPFGSNPRLFYPDSIMPTFLADLPGDYVLSLTVTNGSLSDTATVTISTTSTPPVANAGPNQTVAVGSTVVLIGGGSTSGSGNPLTYSWTLTSLPSGSAATLTGANTVSPTFVVDKAGTYTAQLVVNDGSANSSPSTVTITTQTVKPVANAGPSQFINVGALVQLNGAGSTDANGLPLTYKWTLITLPGGSAAALSSTTAVNPTFTADQAGTYVAQLIVNNGTFDSDPSTVTITTQTPLAPTANAGANQTVSLGSTVTLNGSGTDPQSLPLTYQWSIINKPAGSNATLSSATIATPTFVADVAGTYIAQLIVSNGALNSQPATVTISTTCAPPTANAGGNQRVAVGDTVTLNGSNSGDACHSPLTYAWSFVSVPSGSNATLSNPTSVSPTFTADIDGTYVVQLIVNNGFTSSDPATVSIIASTASSVITFTPSPLILGGAPATLTLKIPAAAPFDQTIYLASDSPAVASMPVYYVTIPAGSTSAQVTVNPGGSNGTATITAAAPGLSGTVQVISGTPAVTITLDSTNIGWTKSVNGTVSLTSPAPAGGATVNLSATPGGIVTIQPSTVTIPQGSTTGTFSLTGAALGSATLTAASAGFASASQPVTVSPLGAISLATGITVGPTQSVPFPVSLVTPAPQGGATITLTSSDPSKVTIAPSTVTIDFGSRTPATQPQVTGVNIGSATISASAPGFLGDSKTVQVSANLSFSPSSVNLLANSSQNVTLTLGGSVPPAGLTVTLSSSNPPVATVPSSVTFTPGVSSVSVAVTGGTAGGTVITASAPGFPNATLSVTVNQFGDIVLPTNATVTPGASVAFPVSLSVSAPSGGTTITLATSDSSRVTINPTQLPVPAGSTTPTVQPTITGMNIGTANITATAPGFSPTTQTVKVPGALTFNPASVNVTVGATQNFTLTLSANAPPGGLTVNLSSGDSSIATVPATVLIPAGSNTATFAVTGVAPGSTSIHANSLPAVPDAVAGVAVQVIGNINLQSGISLVPGQAAPIAVSLNVPAPAGGVTVALSSSNTSKVTIAPPTVFIAAGNTAPSAPPQVTGVDIGTATITASANGWTSANQDVIVSNAGAITLPANTVLGVGQTATFPVTLSKAAIVAVTVNLSSNDGSKVTISPSTVLISPGSTTPSTQPQITGVAAGSAVITATATGWTQASQSVQVANLSMSFSPATLTLTGTQTQNLTLTLTSGVPGGVTVNLSSSNTGAATVPSGVVFGPNVTSATVPVTGVAKGSATITATAPGFGNATAAITVNDAQPGIIVPATITVATGQSVAYPIALGTPASGGVSLNLTVGDPSKATLSSGTAFIPSGATVPNATPQLTGNAVGSTTITVSAFGFPTATTQVQVTSPITLTLSPSSITINGNGTQNLTLTASQPAPAGGLTINLVSGNTNVATVPPTVSIQGSATSVTVPVTGVGQGQTTITATSPSAVVGAPATVIVTAPSSIILSQNTTVEQGKTAQISVSISPAPQSPVTVTLASSDTSKVTVSPATVVVNGSPVQAQVTGVAVGSVNITASAASYTTASGVVTVTPPVGGSMMFSPSTLGISTGGSGNLTLSLSVAPQSNLTVALTSSDTTRATVPATVTVPAGATTATVPVTGVVAGSSVITATAPNYGTANASVTVSTPVGIVVPATFSVQPNQTVPFPVTLGTPAGAGGVFISLASSDTSKLTINPSGILIPQNATAPVTSATITGVAQGTATITASSFGFATATSTVQIGQGGGATLALTSATIAAGTTQNLTLTLSAAQASPVTVSLVSGNTGIATVSSSVTIPAGATAAAVPVNGVNGGSTTITATAPGFASASGNVTVTVVQLPSISVSSDSVLIGQSVNLQVKLSALAGPSGVSVALTSSDTSKATVAPNVFISANTDTAIAQVTGVNAGAVTITATASGYVPGTGQVQVTSPTGGTSALFPNTLAINQGSTGNLTLSLSAAVGSDTTATLTSSNNGIAVVPASVTIPAGASSVSLVVNGIAQGGPVTITANTPNFGTATASVTVNPPQPAGIIVPATLNLQAGQTVDLPISLGSPAGSGGVLLSISSSDPTVATVSIDSINVKENQTTPARGVQVTAVKNGTATVVVSSFGFTSASTQVQVGTPALAMTFSPSTLTVNSGSTQNLTLTLSAPAPAGGLSVSLTSSNTGVVSIASGVTIQAGSTSATVPVTGVAAGTTTITASAPSVTSATATVTVPQPASISVGNTSVTVGQSAPLSVTLTTPAPAGGLTVSLISSDNTTATVTSSVFIAGGATTPSSAPQVTGVVQGTATITATAPNYVQGSGQVQVAPPGSSALFPSTGLTVSQGSTGNLTLSLSSAAPSGGLTATLSSTDTSLATVPVTVAIAGGSTSATVVVTGVAQGGPVTITANTPGFGTASASITVGPPQPVGIIVPATITVKPGAQISFPVTLGTPAGPGGILLELTSSNPSRVSISPTSIGIREGNTAPTVVPTISGIVNGAQETITVTSFGFTPAVSTVLVTDLFMTFSPSSATIKGTGTQTFTLNLSQVPPAGGLVVNLSSSNTSVATVPQTVNFATGVTSMPVTVTGVGAGTATITASTVNIPNATASITVENIGVGVSAPALTLGQTNAPLSVTLSSPAPSAVTLNLTSSDPSKVSLSTGTITIAAGATTPTTPATLTANGVGSATITASTSTAGYATGTGTATVSAPSIALAPGTLSTFVGRTDNLTLTMTGGVAPPGGFTINTASSNTGIATVPAAVTIPAGSSTVTVPVTGAGEGSATITASASGIAPASATVNVTQPAIALSAGSLFYPGQPGTLQITLTNAPQNALTINLNSSDTSKVTVPATVTVPAGSTTATATLTSTGTGSATITASGSGYKNGTTTVNVSANGILLTPTPFPVNVGFSNNLTVGLLAPLASPLTVTLNSNNTGFATLQQQSVTIAAGSTSAPVGVNGVAEGSTSITATAPNFSPASVPVNVTEPSVAVSSGNVTLGDSGTVTVTLSAPAPVNVTVNLASSDTSKVTVTSPVSIAVGASTGTATVTGTGIGSATITGAAANYKSGSGTWTVPVPVISFSGSPLNLNLSTSGNLTLNMTNGRGPASGLTVNLSSADTTVATVPSTVSFAPGSSSVTVPVNAVGGGSSNITASVPGTGIASATGTVNVVTGTISVASGAVNLGSSGPLQISLSAPATKTVTVTLTSSNPAIVGVSANVTIPAGQSSANATVTGNAIGAATINATAPAYNPGQGSVNVPSPQLAFSATSMSISATDYGVASLHMTNGQAPAGGFTVNLSSSNPAVATAPATVTFPAGSTTVDFQVTGVSQAAQPVTITVSAPNLQQAPPPTLTVTVGPAPVGNINVTDVSVGQNLEGTITITVTTPPPANLPLTISSGDPTKLLISGHPTQVGSDQIGDAKILAGDNIVTGIYVQALAGSGTVPIIVSAAGYRTGTATVTLTPSGFRLLANGASTLTTNAGAPVPLTVNSVRLDSSSNVIEVQALRPGLTPTITIDSSAPSVGTASAVAFAGGSDTATSTFTPVTTGTTMLTALTPSGFQTPASGANVVNATVTQPGITCTPVAVGQNLEVSAGCTLQGGTPPASVTITRNDPNIMLATSPTGPGSASITVNTLQIGGGVLLPGFYVYGVGNSGNSSYTVTATGYSNGLGVVVLSPSGFILVGPGGVGAPGFTMLNSTASISVVPARLDSSMNYIEAQGLAGTTPMTVSLSNSSPSAATLSPSTLTIPTGNANGVTTTLTRVGSGGTTVSINEPNGLSIPNPLYTSLNVTISGVTFSITGTDQNNPVYIGQNLEANGIVTLFPAQAGDTTFTLTSQSPSLLLSRNATTAGTQSITVTIPAGQTSASYYLQALAGSGTVSYTATSSFGALTAQYINLVPSGIAFLGSPLATVNLSGGPTNTVISLATFGLNPSDNSILTGQQPLRGGMAPVQVAVASSRPDLATIDSPVTLVAGANQTGATLRPQRLSAGQGDSTFITIAPPPPAGFTTPTSGRLAISVFVTP
jgi:hypothetical protein